MNEVKPLWDDVVAWARAEIERARDTLEQADDPTLRGRISAMRDLLRLPEAQPRQPEDRPGYDLTGGPDSYT